MTNKIVKRKLRHKIQKKAKVQTRHSIGIVMAFVVAVLVIIGFSIFRSNSNTDENNSKNVQAAEQTVWAQFDGNPQKNGTNNTDPLNTSNVASLAKVWSVPVSADNSPVFLSSVTTSQGVKNLVFVTTQGGELIAFDEATGTQVWSKTTTGGAGPITSSPAIDPNNQFIYSYGKDGKVHKYDVGTGNEETANGWPFTATTIPNVEKGSSALSIGNGFLYVTTSAYPGDAGQYVGHIAGKNLTSGTVSVFNTLCANQTQLLSGSCASRQSGVWARPGAVIDPTTGNVFIASGNGPYAPPNDLGDSVIELSSDLSKVIDTYTPTTNAQLNSADADLGSTDVAIVPSAEIGIQGGKDDKIRVLNLKNLSGQGSPYHTGGEIQTLSVACNIFSLPISWTDASNTTWVFVTDMCTNLYAYKVAGTTLTQVYKNSNGGSSPLMVNGMLFVQSSGSIKAINPTTGSILWTGSVGSMHWQSPAVVDGHVFVIDSGNLTAFTVPNLPTATAAPQVTVIVNPTDTIAPSPFVCLGSCPTVALTQAPTTIVPTPTTAAISPCITGTTSVSIDAKSHKKQNNNNTNNLLQLLISFLLQLIQLLIGGVTGTPTPTTPCITPTP